MDEPRLAAAFRFLTPNPVRAEYGDTPILREDA
jgi:hypothetical protein